MEAKIDESQSWTRGLKPRRAALVFIFVTIVLDVLGMGMVIPVMPTLIREVGHIGKDQTTLIFGLFGTTWAVMQLLSSPVQGAMSDCYGRRPVILTSNFGMGCNYLLMAVAPNLVVLWIGRVISGVTSGSVPAAVAYIADVTPPEKRAAAMGLLGAAFSFGFAVGPAIGGVLGGLDPRAPFWAAAGLSLLNGLYGLFVLPESLPRERRAPLQVRRMNPIGAIYALLVTHPVMSSLLVVSFLFSLAQFGPNNVFILYCQDRYQWTTKDVGLFMTGSGVGGLFVQILVIPFAVKWLGERLALITGGLIQTVGVTLFAIAATGVQFWMALPVACLGAIAGPAWSSILTRQVGPSEQGLLAGATSSLTSLSQILSPVLFTMSFYVAQKSNGWVPLGAPFLLAAVCMLAALALAARATRNVMQPA